MARSVVRSSADLSKAFRSSIHQRYHVAVPMLLRFFAGVALVSCTLTRDDFEPRLVDTATLAPSDQPGVPLSEAPPASNVVDCTPAVPCPDGFECVGGACVPSASTCSAAEGLASCGVEVCLGDGCGVAPCSDGRRGDGETDIDCGGPCTACVLGAGCRLGSDCESGVCLEAVCVAPSCSDGVQDQDETGPDCGGTTCQQCGPGVGCVSDADCADGLSCAAATRLCRPVSCEDGVRNGVEAGIDCGGSCAGCGEGADCASGPDCASGVCSDGACAAPSCTDDVRNADETDVDCGSDCAACGDGLACGAASDCQSAVCAGLACADGVVACCQAASCADGVRNGSESAVDCGGDRCARCALGRPCGGGADCASNVCAAGSCQSLCDDGDQNGDETGVDCGGSEFGCGGCGDGQGCDSDADCSSDRCDGGVCGSCADGVENGGELGLDCGSGEPGCPACPRCTVENSVGLGTAGTLTSIPANACAQIASFPGYAPGILESYADGPYPVPFAWVQECTGRAGNGVFERPYHQVAFAGLGVDCPVIVDLGGSAVNMVLVWY
jgi:hypothetical protein